MPSGSTSNTTAIGPTTSTLPQVNPGSSNTFSLRGAPFVLGSGDSIATADGAPTRGAEVPARLSTSTRIMSWNVYYSNLGQAWRVNGIADGIVRVGPEIASIQEMWGEKHQILARLRAISRGREWSFAQGGAVDRSWDGDVLYRSDIWRHLDSGVIFHPHFRDRGISWAALRRHADGAGVLVYGLHPTCCAGDGPAMALVHTALGHMRGKQAHFGFPVALVGDMNTNFWGASQRMLRDGAPHGFRFFDAWALLNPGNPNPPTIGNVRIDFVYFQRGPRQLGQITGAHVWYGLPGGSDHHAVSGDVTIR